MCDYNEPILLRTDTMLVANMEPRHQLLHATSGYTKLQSTAINKKSSMRCIFSIYRNIYLEIDFIF